jgi:hypothetical protein
MNGGGARRYQASSPPKRRHHRTATSLTDREEQWHLECYVRIIIIAIEFQKEFKR